MTKKVLFSVLIGLSLLGLADALYLADKAAVQEPLFCDIGAGLNGCNVVAQSPYSRLFDIPLAYYGVVFYLLLLAGPLLTLWRPWGFMYKALLVLTGSAALASMAFLYIQFVLIRALCVYCVASAVIAFISFGVAYLLYTRFAPKLPVVIK